MTTTSQTIEVKIGDSSDHGVLQRIAEFLPPLKAQQ